MNDLDAVEKKVYDLEEYWKGYWDACQNIYSYLKHETADLNMMALVQDYQKDAEAAMLLIQETNARV